jgi:hypothetical protein
MGCQRICQFRSRRLCALQWQWLRACARIGSGKTPSSGRRPGNVGGWNLKVKTHDNIFHDATQGVAGIVGA